MAGQVHLLLRKHNPSGRPIGATTDLANDLSIDSVAAMDLIMELEEHFGIDIPINQVSDLVTAGDLVALVRRQVAPDGDGGGAG